MASQTFLLEMHSPQRATFTRQLEAWMGAPDEDKQRVFQTGKGGALRKVIEAVGITVDAFWAHIVPFMVHHATELLTSNRPLPFLRQSANSCECEQLSLSREQVLGILAGLFLGWLVPPTSSDGQTSDLFQHHVYSPAWFERSAGDAVCAEKCKCLMAFWKQALEHPDAAVRPMKLTRVRRTPVTMAEMDARPLCAVEALMGMEPIESVPNAVAVDFANSYLGGGYFEEGCVQEELMFACAPALAVSAVLCHALLPNEAVVIEGAVTVAVGRGYSDAFKYVRPTPELPSADEPPVVVTAIDAMDYRGTDASQQWQLDHIGRELTKAAVGFAPLDASDSRCVATGKWGCGAFEGDTQLKFLIQWMAASVAQRPRLVMCTYGDSKLKAISALAVDVQRIGLRAGDLWRFLAARAGLPTEDILTAWTVFLAASHGVDTHKDDAEGRSRGVVGG